MAAIVSVVDLVRFGVVIRALRRRRGWRQSDLAAAASVSQDVVSMIERGSGGRMSFDTLARVAAALEARVLLEVRWRAGELDRLLDQDHGALAAAIGERLGRTDWDVRFEVTYAIFGANGSIDVLAWHAPTGTLLVVEIKTEVTSGEATLRKLDEKVRLAAQIAFERFGWSAKAVAKLLVIQDTTTARDRVTRARALFGAAFPARTATVRSWLWAPSGQLSGLLFVRLTNQQRGTSKPQGRHRIRKPAAAPSSSAVSAIRAQSAVGTDGPGTTLLTNRAYDAGHS